MERLREKGNVVQLIGQQFWPEKTVLFQKKKSCKIICLIIQRYN